MLQRRCPDCGQAAYVAMIVSLGEQDRHLHTCPFPGINRMVASRVGHVVLDRAPTPSRRWTSSFDGLA